MVKQQRLPNSAKCAIALVRRLWVMPSGSTVLAQVAFNFHFVRRVPVQYTYGDRSGTALGGDGRDCHIVG